MVFPTLSLCGIPFPEILSLHLLQRDVRHDMGCAGSKPTSPLNQQLNDCARNTNDAQRLRALIDQGADLRSTNGNPWHHTPLHQACYHNRPIMVRALLEIGAYEACAQLHSNPCGRGAHGTPIELARGGGHSEVVRILEEYGAKGAAARGGAAEATAPVQAPPVGTRSAPVPELGNGWELYMVNGPAQHKETLRYGRSPQGCGDLASQPASGAHKMAEAVFDGRGFTEVLAVGNDGSWAHVVKKGGAPILASDAFRVGAAGGYALRFSNGHCQDSPGNDPWGAKGNHGPFFVDVWHTGRTEAGQWMWCDAEFGGPERLRMGKVLGTGGACFADENGGFVWRWYGRAPSGAQSSESAAKHPAMRLVEEGLESMKAQLSPASSDDADARTFTFSKVKKVEVGRVLSWHEYRARAEQEGGRLPTTAELAGACVDVGYDQWTPITASTGDRETGRRDGTRSDGENAWANIGPHKYMIEYPSWGLDGSTHPWKHLTYFYVAVTAPPPPAHVAPTKPVVMDQVVEGVAIAQAQPVGGGSDAEPPTLAKLVELLQRELGIKGTMREVIDQSCEQLGVEQKGKSLVEQAHECWRVLGGGSANAATPSLAGAPALLQQMTSSLFGLVNLANPPKDAGPARYSGDGTRGRVSYPYAPAGWLWGISVAPDASYALVGTNYPHCGSPHPFYKISLVDGAISTPVKWGGRNPIGVAIAPSGAYALATSTDGGCLARIDLSTFACTYPFTGLQHPTGVAISPSGAHRGPEFEMLPCPRATPPPRRHHAAATPPPRRRRHATATPPPRRRHVSSTVAHASFLMPPSGLVHSRPRQDCADRLKRKHGDAHRSRRRRCERRGAPRRIHWPRVRSHRLRIRAGRLVRALRQHWPRHDCAPRPSLVACQRQRIHWLQKGQRRRDRAVRQARHHSRLVAAASLPPRRCHSPSSEALAPTPAAWCWQVSSHS